MAAPREDETHRIDIMLMGSPGVGAKNLVRRFIGEDFKEGMMPTIGRILNEVHREVDGTEVDIKLWSLLHLNHTHQTWHL